MMVLLFACAGATPAVLPEAPPREGPVHRVFPPPTGASAVKTDAFGDWLRDRPVSPPSRPVKTHAGATVHHRAQVVDIGLVSGDLQQCADSVMRLRAEWQRQNGKPVSFHATSGDALPWKRYQGGERPVERNNRIAWVPATREATWEGYLKKVFMWAGTRSLHAYDSVPAEGPPRPGDLLVAPGSPGHAVILMDVATRGEEIFVLVGEGFMPAQDFHIELGPVDGWWRWAPGVDLGHWDLTGSQAHRRFE